MNLLFFQVNSCVIFGAIDIGFLCSFAGDYYSLKVIPGDDKLDSCEHSSVQ